MSASFIREVEDLGPILAGTGQHWNEFRILFSMTTEMYELAGMTDESGNLYSHLPARSWVVPHIVELIGERTLLWWGNERGPARPDMPPYAYGKVVTDDQRMLTQFAKISSESGPLRDVSRRVLRFARRWGVLNSNNSVGAQSLCGTDVTELDNEMLEQFSLAGWELNPTGSMLVRASDTAKLHEVNLESAMDWLFWSARARSILNVSAHLHRGTPIPGADWYAIYQWLGPLYQGLHDLEIRPIYDRIDEDIPGGFKDLDWNPSGRLTLEEQVEAKKSFIAFCIQFWMSSSETALHFDWDSSGPQVSVGGGNLFAALGAQLLLAVGRTRGLYVCSECGDAFIPEGRKPRTDRRVYCPTCRKFGAPQRNATNRHRARKH